jgi:hypothetical protein
MCASHIIDEIMTALLGCVSIAAAFRDGMAFLLVNARRSHLILVVIARPDDSVPVSLSSENAPK